MTIRVDRRAVKRLLRSMQGMLLAFAVSALGYCGFVLLDSWIFQHREATRLEEFVHPRPAAGNHAQDRMIIPAATSAPAAVTADGLIGRIAIPRLGLSVIVVEGTEAGTLRRAAGHIAGTALPGQRGNVGIAGHRDTFFRELRNILENDVIRFTTPGGDYRYRVVSLAIVSPTDVAILAPGPTQSLTLVTCYPFNFVGSAPSRYIVRAERIT